MASGFSDSVTLDILDHSAGGTAWTAPTTVWIQLHTGVQGAEGTTNIANNSTRKQITFSSASGTNLANSADIDWTTGEVTLTEVYAYYSTHSASTAGVCIHLGTVTGGSVTNGNAFKIAAGDLDFDLTRSVPT